MNLKFIFLILRLQWSLPYVTSAESTSKYWQQLRKFKETELKSFLDGNLVPSNASSKHNQFRPVRIVIKTERVTKKNL